MSYQLTHQLGQLQALMFSYNLKITDLPQLKIALHYQTLDCHLILLVNVLQMYKNHMRKMGAYALHLLR